MMMNERFDEIICLFPLLGNKQNWYVHPTPEKFSSKFQASQVWPSKLCSNIFNLFISSLLTILAFYYFYYFPNFSPYILKKLNMIYLKMMRLWDPNIDYIVKQAFLKRKKKSVYERKFSMVISLEKHNFSKLSSAENLIF